MLYPIIVLFLHYSIVLSTDVFFLREFEEKNPLTFSNVLIKRFNV